MQIRLDALLHIDYDPMRSVVIGCEFGLNDCLDHDKGDQDLVMIGPHRYIHSVLN